MKVDVCALAMKIIVVCLFIGFLAGCKSTDVSENITQNTIKEVIEVKKVIKQIEEKTPIECKSELFLSQLQTITTQTDSIKAQVENISLACQTEKNVLREKIKIRELIIACFIAIMILILCLRLKGK
jgi:hypothetical protein